MSDRCRDWAWNISRSEGTSRLVLLRIAETIDDVVGWVDPTIEVVAEAVRTKRRSVQRAIRDLEELGDIAVESLKGRRGTNRYSMPACPPLEDEGDRLRELMARPGILRLPDRVFTLDPAAILGPEEDVTGDIGDPATGDTSDPSYPVVGDTPPVVSDALEGDGDDTGDGLRPSRVKNARVEKRKTKLPTVIGEASSPAVSKKEARAAAQKAKVEERVATSQRILDAVVEIQGYPIANYARTRKGIYDMMAAGYSEAEILAAWRICQDSDWHKAHAAGVSAQLVHDRIGPLRKEGRLPADPSGVKAAVRWGL